MKTIVRAVLISLGGILVLLGAGIVFAGSQVDTWGRRGFEYQLGRVLGAPVTIEGLAIRPFDRCIEIRNLSVASPEPFEPGPALVLGRGEATIDAGGLFRNPVDVPEVTVEELEIHLRYLPGHGTNIQALTTHAKEWRESMGALFGKRSLHVGRLETRNSTLTTYALGRSVSVPLADTVTEDVTSDAPGGSGAMGAFVLRRVLRETMSTETVVKGLKERFGSELEKWIGENPI